MLEKLFRTRSRHDRLPQQDNDLDSEALLPSSHPTVSLPSEAGVVDRSNRDLRIAVKTLFISTLVYVAAGLCIVYSLQNAAIIADADDFCMHHVSRDSPVVMDVKPGWHDKLFNGSFLHQNRYRQPASPETDAAWESLGVNYRSIVVPEEEAEKAGIKRDQVKISQEYGGGFPANVEGLHHLHCLDLLRKSLHWNYDYYVAKKEGAFVNSPYIVRVHTTHCLDILRQVLMCTPDVGVLGQVWWQPEGEANPMPFVDFNTKHRCRDYEGVRAWAEAHQLPPEGTLNMSHFYEMPKPGDTIYPEIP